MPRRLDTREKAEFWPPELREFDEDYWAARSELPGDTSPDQLARWRTIFATRAYYQARQEWAKQHGGDALAEIIAHCRMRRRLLDQMHQAIPDLEDAV